MMEDLVSTALLGTRGSTPRLPTLPHAILASLPELANDAELQLLDAAAAVTLYTRAGAKPRTGINLHAPAGADRWAECSPAAAEILARVSEESLQPVMM